MKKAMSSWSVRRRSTKLSMSRSVLLRQPVLASVFTARCYASVVYAVVVCLSLSIHLSQAGIVSKPLNTESCKQRHMIAEGL